MLIACRGIHFMGRGGDYSLGGTVGVEQSRTSHWRRLPNA